METNTLTRPEKFIVYSLVGPKITKTRTGESVRYWEVVYKVNESRHRKRFTSRQGGKASAVRFSDALCAGWSDPSALWDDVNQCWKTKRGLLVGHWLLEHWQLKLADWEAASKPRPRSGLARGLFGFSDAAPSIEVKHELDAFLSRQTKEPGSLLDAYIKEHSMELADVKADDCQRLLLAYLTDNKGTQKSWTNILVGAWELALKRGHIDVNPWKAVVWQQKTKSVTKCDKVLSPAQVWKLSVVCGQGRKKKDAQIIVLVMGLCGLRFGEARALSAKCVSKDGKWLTFSHSARNVSAKWLTPGDDPLIGPLKGRKHGEYRKVPIPDKLAPVLLEHATARREAGGADALLFTGRDGNIINPGSFGKSIWKPAVEQMFGGTEFAMLRKHDLRHAACSAWLSAGVPFKIAQSWSGHKNLSVFLNIYQGVVVGQEEDGVARLNAWVDTQTKDE